MAPHHEPFKALAPIEWERVSKEDPKEFLTETFANVQTIIESIPAPAALTSAATTGRARSHTDPPVPVGLLNRSLSQRQSAHAIGLVQDLLKEWKEVKLNPRDNPLAINVYKLAAKDGKGAWFARRSIHDGLTFEKFKLGLEREFAETMKVQTGPGGGSIRGIGAERRVAYEVIEDTGKMEVFQLSAQFPGPTTPRDFITLLLTSDASDKPLPKDGKRPLRQFVIVSKPCIHPECPPRQGFIRGQYESVEIIREIPSDKHVMKRARSSIDLGNDAAMERQSIAENMGREAILRAARKTAEAEDGRKRERGISVDSAPARGDAGHGADSAADDNEEFSTSIEWLMVTRSDPGGSVPRFMIEKGTPGGIVSDAGKFIKWCTAKAAEDFASSEDNDFKKEAINAEDCLTPTQELPHHPTMNLVSEESSTSQDENVPSSNGLYGMISGAFGAVATRLPSGLPNPFGNSTATSTIHEDDEDSTYESDTSSVRSFASALEGDRNEGDVMAESLKSDAISTHSSESQTKSNAPAQSEKELKKLQDRRRKVQEKMAKMQERISSKRVEDTQRDAAAMAKLRDKHEREIAKQEEKYKRELKRLDQKREQEERKAEERRKKQADREEKTTIQLELEKVKSERDLALKQIEILKDTIGELQGQNTMLVAKLGRLGGLQRQDSSWSSKSAKQVHGEKLSHTQSLAG